jgi:hypothetical protein
MQPGVLATLMNISQKVMVDCASTSRDKIKAGNATNKMNVDNSSQQDVKNAGGIACKSGLDESILQDWLAEAVHQLTRTAATNTTRVAADNLLVTIASKHNFFHQVLLLIA